jgi:general secretion pathway protein C
MSQNSNTKTLYVVATVLALLVFVKLIWVVLEYMYLPEKGINLESGTIKRSLHYRYRFASDVELPKVSIPSKPTKPTSTISNLKLVGIYSASKECIVTILKGNKSFILAKGEDVDGFVLIGALEHEAHFEKSGKKFVLKLYETKSKNSSSITPVNSEEDRTTSAVDSTQADIVDQGGIRTVPRTLLKEYASDIKKAMRDIGLRPVSQNGSMHGYKVRFIRRGSPFSKLGLKRGDIIKSINGEEIVDLNGPMSVLKSIGSIDGMTITVVRGTEEKDLEYEVK